MAKSISTGSEAAPKKDVGKAIIDQTEMLKEAMEKEKEYKETCFICKKEFRSGSTSMFGGSTGAGVIKAIEYYDKDFGVVMVCMNCTIRSCDNYIRNNKYV